MLLEFSPVFANVVETLPLGDNVGEFVVEIVCSDSGGFASDQITDTTPCAIQEGLLLVHIFQNTLQHKIYFYRNWNNVDLR